MESIDLVKEDLLDADLKSDESAWPSLNLGESRGSVGESEEVDIVESIDLVKEDLLDADLKSNESEWPSLNLGVNRDSADESLGIHVDMNPVKIDLLDTDLEGGESECSDLSLNPRQNPLSAPSSAEEGDLEKSVIPGLPTANTLETSEDDVSKSDQFNGLDQSDIVESPLGELRFQE